MFDASEFDATYNDRKKSISKEAYQQSWIKAKEGFEVFKKTQAVEDDDGFVFVAPSRSKKQVRTLTKATASNSLKTGAIMAGKHATSGKYVFYYAMSGNDYKTDVNSLRSHCAINLKKHTYCAEENLIVSHLGVRFYACIAFRIEDTGVVVIPPCGLHDPFAKCKLTLRTLDIEYVMQSADL
jgi:hypothetical protein